MSRARSTTATASRLTNSNPADAIFSLGTQREDLAYYVRHTLTREERLVVMLRYAEELPFDEIAGIMSMPQDEVESIHEQIVSRLRKNLKKSCTSKRELCLAGI